MKKSKFMLPTLNLVSLMILLTCWANMLAVQQRWDGDHYTNNSSVQFSAGKKLLESLNFKGDESVLDIGCGAGMLASIIAQKYVPNGHVTAIDNDSSMIEKAQEVHKDIPNLTIVHQDATTIDTCTTLDSNKYDIILSVFCLHWVPDAASMQRVLDGVARCLKPGGKFVAVFYTQDNAVQSYPEVRVAQELVTKPKWKDFYKNTMPLGNTLSLTDYQATLDKAGLKGTATVHQTPAVNLSREQLKGAVATLPFAQPIPQSLKEDFLEEFFADFTAQRSPNDDGTYPVAITGGLMQAHKPHN